MKKLYPAACICSRLCIFFLFLCIPRFWGCGVQTVELSDCEKIQALALRVLLSLSKFNQHRIHEMDCYHGYSMIHQVLIKSKCIVGYHMLKVSHVYAGAALSSYWWPSAVTWPSDCVCNWAVWWLFTEMDPVCIDVTLSSCIQDLWLPLSLQSLTDCILQKCTR